MRSILAKILFWSFGTLVVSLIAFVAISSSISSRAVRRGEPFGGLPVMQLEDAREAFESGGPERLKGYMQRLNRFFPGDHFLTDGAGRDLLTGDDRSALLAQSKSSWDTRRFFKNRVVIARPSEDGKYWFVVIMGPPISIWSFVPYYLLILGAVALLCYILAVSLAAPLRALGRTVEQFGRGDLAARVKSTRRDEIGELARSFDEMADRIQTLLTAERRLLQDVSHELRSPLARLSFAIELTKTAENRELAVAQLKKEMDRLNSLVGALLQVTRVEGDPSSQNLENLALDELLKEIVNDCSIEADARNCHIQLNNGPNLLMCGDRELLRRAIENVLRNAIHHAPDGTSIEVDLGSVASNARITVRDCGAGVPEGLLGDIFKPFFRVDASRNGASGGVGLGLAITQRAVTLHHGRIWAENVNPGLLICMELPVVEPGGTERL
jgi:two-component system sensor histidine kinase CpxA